MEARAVARYIRISPFKMRRVVDQVRGKDVDEALERLRFLPKKGARILEKVIRSAIANAENNLGLDIDKLYVKRAYADEGPTLKRWMPRAMGRATKILKRTSHITVVVAER